MPDPPSGGYRGLQNRLYRVEIHSANGGAPTYKWARDNGASAFAVEELINEDATGTDRIRVRRLGRDPVLALAEGQWIEVLDDGNILEAEPGTFVQTTDVDEEARILSLSEKVQGMSVARHARVRRWDGGPTAVSPGTAEALEHGIDVTFGGGAFTVGDYWVFAARTATGEIEELVEAPPHGIRHAYAPLALVKWTQESGGTIAVEVDDCRPAFPPLTGIAAEDVAFDNAACELTTTDNAPAETVQEALEVLCASHGLQHHNTHLHGWGIVSGLKVVCDPEDRNRVIVRDGWVIDRAGHDIHIPETSIDLMGMVADHDDGAETPILTGGVGDAWLAWDSSEAGSVGPFVVEPYTADWKKELNERMLETLLLEFYRDCVEDVQRFFERELTPPPGREDDPAGPQQERVAALSNLLMQRVNPQAGQHLLLTRREHEILRGFYDGLKAELSLETFCGLFDDARPYPDELPESIEGLDTIFGRGQHQRLRVPPGSAEAYSVGPGVDPRRPATTINRWGLRERRLLAQINPLAGRSEGGRIVARGRESRPRPFGARRKADTGAAAVQDIAFSAEGRRIYMVAATRNGEDTLFRAGEIGRDEISWGDVFTICDLKLVTLATTAADRNRIYAIAHRRQGGSLVGDGLYRIDPDALADGTQPVRVGEPFNAVGHLRLAPSGEAWATESATAGRGSGSYTGVRHFSNVAAESPAVDQISFGGLRGRDDIAVFRTEDGARVDTLYAVAETTSSAKVVLAYQGTQRVAQVPVESTAIRLEVYPPTRALLMTSEDGYGVRILDMDSNQGSPNLVPMQLGPIAVAADPARDRVHVLNYLSSTLTTARGDLFDPGAPFRSRSWPPTARRR